MSNTPKVFREATLKSAVKCMKDMQFDIAGIEITSSGTIRILTGAPGSLSIPEPEEPNPFDEPQPKHGGH